MSERLINIFIIYAREDATALEELRAHLSPIEEKYNLIVWYDGKILPGQDWDRTIKQNIASSDIILLFISKYFFNSNYIIKTELIEALARHGRGEVEVIPIIVSPCLWQEHFVGKFHALPENGNPVYSSSWHNPDEAFVSILKDLKKALLGVNAQRAERERSALAESRRKEEEEGRRKQEEKLKKEAEEKNEIERQKREEKKKNEIERQKKKAEEKKKNEIEQAENLKLKLVELEKEQPELALMVDLISKDKLLWKAVETPIYLEFLLANFAVHYDLTSFKFSGLSVEARQKEIVEANVANLLKKSGQNLNTKKWNAFLAYKIGCSNLTKFGLKLDNQFIHKIWSFNDYLFFHIYRGLKGALIYSTIFLIVTIVKLLAFFFKQISYFELEFSLVIYILAFILLFVLFFFLSLFSLFFFIESLDLESDEVRALLFFKGLIPLKLKNFLNEMVACQIMETDGKKWWFKYPEYQDYFAGLRQDFGIH